MGKFHQQKLDRAIKAQGDREFSAEMETIGKVKHPNVVQLVGCCSSNAEKLLVYEYLTNGDLYTWLRNRIEKKNPLDWESRLKIAIGSAKGLSFLHHGFIPHVIHRDLKSSNILLDENLEPKLADFGYARLISDYELHVTSLLVGTYGCIPPEYGQIQKVTTKGDVYSFGVILLELVTGKVTTGNEYRVSEGGNLAGWVLWKNRNGLAEDVLDPTILNAYSRQAMLSTLKIAAECLSENPVEWPTMEEVLARLQELSAGSSCTGGI